MSFQNKLAGGGGSDIEFLRKKALSGDLIHVVGNGVTGEILSYTPPTGKTFYHLSSSVYLIGLANSLNAINKINVEIRNNAVAIDNLGGEDMRNSGSGSVSQGAGSSVIKSVSNAFSSLIGDAAKKFSINVVNHSSGTIYASMHGWIENT